MNRNDIIKAKYKEYKEIFEFSYLNIEKLAIAIYEWNKINGFWDNPRTLVQVFELVRSEKTEAFEAMRKPSYLEDMQESSLANKDEWLDVYNIRDNKDEYENIYKNSIQTEVADFAIRMLDYLGYLCTEYKLLKATKNYIGTPIPYPNLNSDFEPIGLVPEKLYELEKRIMIMEVEYEYEDETAHYSFSQNDMQIGYFLNTLISYIRISALYFNENKLESLQAKLYYNLLRPYKHGKNK